MARPVLGYWDIRGLGEPLRLLLEYCGTEYEDRRYEPVENFGDKDCEWNRVKSSLGLDFPNLPYYIEGDFKLTESLALLKHIGGKNDLLPESGREKTYCNMLEGVVNDLRMRFAMVCYMPEFEKNKAEFFASHFPEKMKLFDKFLANKKWLAGDRLTYVDFQACEFFDHYRLLEPNCYDGFKNITAYLDKFFSLDKIAAYRQSSRFKKLPINLKFAHWGGKPE